MNSVSGDAQGSSHGLFRLYPGEKAYDPEECVADIVAIHGLGGRPMKTWTDDVGHLWLRDSLPFHVPGARIMTYGYDSKYWFNESRMVLNDFSNDLLNRLSLERQLPKERRRPLIFICHSLGGLIAKRLLIQTSVDHSQYEDLAQSIHGMVFLGTPHRGSRAVSTAKILADIANLATLGAAVRQDFLELLKVSSIELTTISQLSTSLLEKLSIVSFYETRPLKSKIIVEQFSAILGLPHERTIPLNTDHKQMSKVSPKDAQQYLPVWSAIKEMVEACKLKASAQVDNLGLLGELYCFDYKTSQLRVSQPSASTCDWIFANPTYQEWTKASETAVMWLSGQPGAGKSVISRHIIDTVASGSVSVSDQPGGPAISFFCTSTIQILSPVESILRSLLHQILHLNPLAGSLIRNCIETPEKDFLSIDLDKEKLWKALLATMCMEIMSNALLVIDAVEEIGMEAAKDFVGETLDLVKHIKKRRPSHRLTLDEKTLETSIGLFLGNKISEFASRNKQFEEAADTSLRQQIITKITERAKGMFLWASTAWKEFSRKTILWNRQTLEERLERLDDLPSGITDLYETILENIETAIRSEALDIFLLMSITAKPLREAQLGTLLGLYRCKGKIKTSKDFEPFKEPGQHLEKHFGSFITIHDDNVVTFSHSSFNDFLLSKCREENRRRLLRVHRGITQACLRYLQLTDILEGASFIDPMAFDRMYPFWSYAVTFALQHLLLLPPEDDLWLEFASMAKAGSIYTNITLYTGSNLPTPLRAILSDVQFADREALLRKVVARGYDVNERWLPRNQRGFTLQYCIRQAKRDGRMAGIASVLLELGADPSLPEEPLRTNFQMAIQSESWQVYESLLKHPWIDLDAKDYNGQTVVHNLVQYGPETKLVQLLEGYSVNVNIQDDHGYTPLHLAIAMNDLEKVRILLQTPGIRLDLADIDYRTPFTLATYWGFQRVASALIQNTQAFPISEDQILRGLLHSAKHGEEHICRHILVRHDIQGPIQERDSSGKGILHLLAMNNWTYLLTHCFLNHGFGKVVDQLDHAGKTSLHYASALGNTASCEVLLRNGASARLRDRLGRTAPQAAADAGFTDTLASLLALGDVDPNQRDIQGRNLVHWAATIDSVASMERIIQREGVEIAKKDHYGLMPIDIAFNCRCANVGHLLDTEMTKRGTYQGNHSIYSWDQMYQSPDVTVDDALLGPSGLQQLALEELQELRAIDKNERDKERKETEKRWPNKLWGLVHVPFVKTPRTVGRKDDESIPKDNGYFHDTPPKPGSTRRKLGKRAVPRSLADPPDPNPFLPETWGSTYDPFQYMEPTDDYPEQDRHRATRAHERSVFDDERPGQHVYSNSGGEYYD